MMKNELLPIGSIVTVGGQDIMICAYFQKGAKVNDQEFDYACCLYPVGMGPDALLIKKEQIEKIKFVGFQDLRFVELKKKLGEENAK